MALAFHLASVAVSGAAIVACSKQMHGIGACRLFVKNTGGAALTAAKVQLGPDTVTVADLDTTTFASLGAGAVAMLAIAAPVDGLVVLATCAAGTTLDVWLTDDVGDS